MAFHVSQAEGGAIALIIGFASIAIGIVGWVLPSQPSNVCTISNALCDQIKYQTSVFGNSSSAQSILTSTSWSSVKNETIVIVANSNIGGAITSITDTAHDTYVQQLFLSQNCVPCQNFEIWTSKYSGITGTTSTITVTWNFTTNNVFVASMYFNVGSIGNATGKNFPSANSGSLTILPFKSGSWITGGIGISPANGESCTSAVAGNGLIQRVDSCSRSIGIPEVEVAIADNATVLRNQFIFSYPYSSNNILTPAIQIGAIELVGTDKEPIFPNFNNFCTNTNGLCVTNQYTLNTVKSTQVNALNKALALNVAYCTGITTSALTTVANNPIWLSGSYGGVALNTTGAKLMIQVYLSSNAPSTTFGSGLCATGGAVVATSDIYFPISGGLSATNAFSVALNGFSSNTNGGALYGWIEITPQNFALGSLGFDQVVNQVYCMSFLNMMEIK